MNKYYFELKEQILSSTTLNDEINIIVDLVKIDVKSILEKIMLQILTQGGDTRYSHAEFTGDTSSFSAYIEHNERYLLEVLNTKETTELIDKYVKSFNKSKFDEYESNYIDLSYEIHDIFICIFPIITSFHPDHASDITNIIDDWIVETWKVEF